LTWQTTAQQDDQKFVYRLNIDAIADGIKKLTNWMEPEDFLNTLVKNSLI